MHGPLTAAKTYTLKPIILARGLAEITVLLILAALPFVLLAFGKFFILHIFIRVGLCVMAPLALLGLWGFSQIAFRVIASEDGLTTRCILKKTFLKWNEMQALRLTNRMGLREYLISHSGGTLSFPSMLNGASELVETIRERLPNRGRSTAGDAQSFRVSAISFGIDLAKLLLQMGFAALCFWFFDSLRKSGKTSPGDLVVVLLLAILVCAGVIWKTILFLRLPREVQLDKDGATFKGLFRTGKIAWSEIKMVAVSGILYPEGLKINTGTKSYLITNSIDAFDELADEIQQRAKKV